MKGDYEEFHALRQGENKSNSKPNKANMPAFDRKSEILSSKSEMERMEAERQNPAHFKECYLKKQTQFPKGQNEHKASNNKCL